MRLVVVLALGALVASGVARGQDGPVIFHAPHEHRGSDDSRQRVAGWAVDNAERALDLRERSVDAAAHRLGALQDEEARLQADLEDARVRLVEAQERAAYDQAVADDVQRAVVRHARRCDFRCVACLAQLRVNELRAVAAGSARTVRDLEARVGALCARLDEVRRAEARQEQRLRQAHDAREEAERRLDRAERKRQRVVGR